MMMVVVRNASDRLRGFLASALVEVGIGVYVSTRISVAVRQRIWQVVSDWFFDELDVSIVFVWEEPRMPGGIAVHVLGLPPIEFSELDGLIVSRRQVPVTDPE
jgi:CRISPR-associated protein Cas2